MTVEQVRNVRRNSYSISESICIILIYVYLGVLKFCFYVAPNISHFKVHNCLSKLIEDLHVGELGDGSDSLGKADSLICPSSVK